MRQVFGMLVLAGALAMADQASAQTAQTPSRSELTVGYQFQRFGIDDGTNMFAGGFLDLGIGRPSIEGVLQVGASRRSEEESFTSGSTTFAVDGSVTAARLMAGVRTRGGGTGVTGYGQVLAGALLLRGSSTVTTTGPGGSSTSDGSESEVEFAAQAGAGIIVPTSDRVHVRIGVDYQRVFTEGGGNIVLASVGIGFKLGR